MIRYRSQKQLTLTGFSSPFRTQLHPENRWVKLADLIPWDDLARAYLILDATVVDQAIRYPTDLSLINEARQFSEQIIDLLYPHTAWPRKTRTYHQRVHQAFLAIVKQRRPSRKMIRRGIKQQLQYLHRNLGHIEALMATWPVGTSIPLPQWLMRRYWVIQHLHDPQWTMYCGNSRRCEDRNVSISQPHVRPIVRGKQHKPLEFGAKLSVSLTDENREQLERLKAQRREECLQRIPIEGKFGPPICYSGFGNHPRGIWF